MFPGKVYVSSGGGVSIIVGGVTVGAVGAAGGNQAGVDDAICDAGIAAWLAQR